MSELVPQESTELSTDRSERWLTREEFDGLEKVPPIMTWFANIRNPNTKRSYRRIVLDFMAFAGISEDNLDDFNRVKRPHVIVWRDTLEKELAPGSVRTALSALSSLFDDLCDANCVQEHPVKGVKRPGEGSNEGKTQAISDAQMSRLLKAPDPEKHKAFSRKLKAYRDRAILATFAFHGLRCSELTSLKVKDIQERRGVKHIQVHGKREKIRYIPAHATAIEMIEDYLEFRGSREREDWLFVSVRKGEPLAQSNIFQNIVRKYAIEAGINPDEFCVHSLRASAGTNALENGADLEQVQEWFGHSNISTTRLYDKRVQKVEDSPTFRVKY